MMKKNRIILFLASIPLIVGGTIATLNINTPKRVDANAALGNFYDDFESYSSYTAMKGNWNNAYLTDDGTFNVDNCNTNIFAIYSNVYGRSGKVLGEMAYNGVSTKSLNSFSWISVNANPTTSASVAKYVVRKFEVSFDVAFPHPTYSYEDPKNPVWFGMMVRRTLKNDTKNDGRFDNVRGAMLTFKILDDTHIQFVPMICNAAEPVTVECDKGGEAITKANLINTWHTIKFVADAAGDVYNFSAYFDNEFVGSFMGESSYLSLEGGMCLLNCVCDVYYDNFSVINKDGEPDIEVPEITDETINSQYFISSGRDVVIDVDRKGKAIEYIKLIKNGSGGDEDTTLDLDTDYSLGKNNLINIKTSFLDKYSTGSQYYVFRLKTNAGEIAICTFNIQINAALDKPTGIYGPHEFEDDHLNVEVNIGNAKFLYISYGDTKLEASTQYISSTKTDSDGKVILTIKLLKKYLSSLTTGTHEFVVSTQGGDFTFAVHVKNGAVVTPVCTPSSSTFYKNESDDVVVNVDLKGNTFTKLQCNGTDLVEGTDYTFVNSVITVKKEYLNSCSKGALTFTVVSTGGNGLFSIIVKESSTGTSEPAVNPVDASQTYYLQTNIPISVRVDLKGLKLVEVTQGSTKLMANRQYLEGNNVITLLPEYLESLEQGVYQYSVSNSQGSDIFTIEVVKQSATYEDPVILGENEHPTIEYKLRSRIDLNLEIDWKNNNFLSLNCEDTGKNLVLGRDFTYSSGKIIVLSSYLDTLEVNEKAYSFFVYTKENGSTYFFVKIQAQEVDLPVFLSRVESFNKSTVTTVTYYVDFNDYALLDIVNEDQEPLTYGTDYTFTTTSITLNYSYLKELEVGEFAYQLVVEDGKVNFTLKVTTSEAEGGAPTVDKLRYGYEIRSGKSLEVPIDLKGLEVESIFDTDTFDTFIEFEDYVLSGNSIILLDKKLDNFSVGRHNIRISTEDGSVDISVKIKASKKIEVHDYSVLATVLCITIPLVLIVGYILWKVLKKKH